MIHTKFLLSLKWNNWNFFVFWFDKVIFCSVEYRNVYENALANFLTSCHYHDLNFKQLFFIENITILSKFLLKLLIFFKYKLLRNQILHLKMWFCKMNLKICTFGHHQNILTTFWDNFAYINFPLADLDLNNSLII